jgi:hypothetical protein
MIGWKHTFIESELRLSHFDAITEVVARASSHGLRLVAILWGPATTFPGTVQLIFYGEDGEDE